jgi:hypothetical protein
VLTTGPKVSGFKSGHSQQILKAFKICSTTSLGRKVKPGVSNVLATHLQHVEEHFTNDELVPYSALRCHCSNMIAEASDG